MNKPKFKIIFDIFGVLISSGFKSSANDLSQVLDIPIPTIQKFYEKWEPDFDRGIITSKEFWKYIIRDLNIYFDEWYLLNNMVLDNYKLNHSSYELYKRYSKITEVYLLSNTRKEWFEILDKKFSITPHCEKAFLSYEIGLIK
ncbi:hypothetical protein JW960_01415, partial [candidate division KSB1 bacterium]|nr:hypothetical protein [candidate division KSB1 bacterium]